MKLRGNRLQIVQVMLMIIFLITSYYMEISYFYIPIIFVSILVVDIIVLYNSYNMIKDNYEFNLMDYKNWRIRWVFILLYLGFNALLELIIYDGVGNLVIFFIYCISGLGIALEIKWGYLLILLFELWIISISSEMYPGFDFSLLYPIFIIYIISTHYLFTYYLDKILMKDDNVW